MVEEHWFCFKCGAEISSELWNNEHEGKCPECKRKTQWIDYYPADKNINKKTMEMTKEEATRENEKLDEILKNPETEPWKAQEYNNIRKYSLQGVYSIFEKWLFIQDTNRIDVLLATVLSNQKIGTPLWIFPVGPSGDTKSEIVMSLGVLENVIIIDQITKNTLASGKPNTADLGSILQNNSTIIIIPDLAALTSLHKDEKKQIWAQFRNLYDGFINKRTGSGVVKVYDNCNVTLIACSTPIIRDEYHINQQLGTRELLYDTAPDPNCTENKMDKSWDNENYETEMREELKEVISGFFRYHRLKDIKIPKKVKDFIFLEANRLSILRASGQIDYKYNELIGEVHTEIPTRAIKQFKRLYVALKSLDENYSDKKAMAIIKHVVNSSGDVIRQKIMNIFRKNRDDWFTIADLQKRLKLGRTKVKIELETLWNIDWLEKKIKVEQIGGGVSYDYGHETIKGGKWQEVAYYKKLIKQLKLKITQKEGG